MCVRLGSQYYVALPRREDRIHIYLRRTSTQRGTVRRGNETYLGEPSLIVSEFVMVDSGDVPTQEEAEKALQKPQETTKQDDPV